MRVLLWIVVVLAVLYAGFWAITVRGLDAGIDRAVEMARDRGWQVEIAERDTSGFPSRFDVTAREVSVASPAGGFGWQAPVVQTAALSYRPNRIIATLPPEQALTLGGRAVALESQAMRASLHVAPSTALGLETLTVEAAALDLAADRGWQISTGPALAAVRRDGPAANAYDVYASVEGLRLMEPDLPGAPEGDGTFTLDAEATFDRPLDRAALAAPALLEGVRVQSLDLGWGALALRATGEVQVDPQGIPEGQIDLEIVQWRDVLAVAQAGGWVPEDLATTIARGVAFFSGGQETLRLPLVFTDGRMALGPIPLGPAPILR
ncbi:DUF2125 domain-containing protein [Salipiger sp. IMCC34102]|uniref:DUF2125 domain-containing protein n=1 Tax=Salipiger sp. IMCC34102 TaxID=2510647 RepID=UPI00101B8EB0|nr:DUF2125 domain-containing protein [Salipiger sp. IMCC34102]RYH03823.1 DUF2125 domain-containing protein [Salipiger sp. IMCC34102]